jgi:hypothetical protein
VSSHAVEPGTRLVDRYRLDEPLGEADGTTYWRAQDELLDRPVGVCLLPASDSSADRVLRAARRAAVLTDARFLRVLDASEVDGVVYVVSEWVSATNLVDLLADGPLQPTEARQLAVDVADALSAAHRAGLAHLCLQPEHVLRTTHGQVKLGGLAVDAAVRDVAAADEDDAARRDTWGAAAIAYAALTARWPGGAGTGLPAAPRDGTALCSPRQVRAGVPHDLDAVLCRALDIPHLQPHPLRTPDELSRALADVHLTSRVPVVRRAEDDTRTDPSYRPPTVSPYDDQAGRPRSRTALLAWGAVTLVLVVGLALAGGQLVMSALDGDGAAGDDTSQSESSSPPASAAATGTPIPVRQVLSFDPLPDGTGEENGDRADRATDGDRSTVWTTKSYDDPFGPSGIKDGVGLVLDLGSSKKVGSVTVWTADGSTDLELRAADQLGETLGDYDEVAKAVDVDGRAVLRPTGSLRARYLLVWLTSVPVADGSRYRGAISEVTVRE